ncbi:1,2-phenylacetyl-CoA epoxidase subunit PaaC [Dictyobacter formicarum]|uniref:Phenylacetate-CoA oxygenase subunit PaaI n=1 Tax=Dictyobacter formicarum TaxID=2778368 RepID=A0ABQ3VGF7_9CHLR|nr:1,2-phenylacetyl-CoA epoxidase subunit PaaC [Dictyobacter formicarum]GHO84453.1 phenylacetate-CoA oxygenase subunit PaaI [Dictyobacter formicarum]
MEFTDASMVPPDLQQPLSNFLLSLADDEFILGYWDSEWTGVAPMLEEDVACSSIAQDEIGHARLFYQEVAALTGSVPDQVAYNRTLTEYRQVQLVERRRGNWAFTCARRFFYETADQVRLASLTTSTYLPLVEAIGKIQREEVYHQMHSSVWLNRLATGTPTAYQMLTEALQQLWPDALGLFEPFQNEDILLAAGILPVPSATLEQRWLSSIVPVFERLQLPLPITKGASSEESSAAVYHPTIAAQLGGRQGQHSADFADLWDQMTMVSRMDPQASW